MKATATTIPLTPEFQPIKVELVIETREELEQLQKALRSSNAHDRLRRYDLSLVSKTFTAIYDALTPYTNVLGVPW